MSRVTGGALAAIGLLAGALAGEFVSKTLGAHRLVGRIFRRGELVALVGRRGIFDADMRAHSVEKQSREQLIANEVLRVSASNAPLDDRELEHAMFAMRAQFGSDRNFDAALRTSRISKRRLLQMAAETIRGEEWIEARVTAQTSVARDEAQRYFEEHPADFMLPLRIRPRHIFLAAPAGAENVEGQRRAMQDIIARLNHGEDFAALAAEVSEDEASKERGGDLGFLARARVPAEFWSAIEKLPLNAPPAMVQTHLGFHAVQIIEVRPVRAMPLEEARLEIDELLAARNRREAVSQLRGRLAGGGDPGESMKKVDIPPPKR